MTGQQSLISTNKDSCIPSCYNSK